MSLIKGTFSYMNEIKVNILFLHSTDGTFPYIARAFLLCACDCVCDGFQGASSVYKRDGLQRGSSVYKRDVLQGAASVYKRDAL